MDIAKMKLQKKEQDNPVWPGHANKHIHMLLSGNEIIQQLLDTDKVLTHVAINPQRGWWSPMFS